MDLQSKSHKRSVEEIPRQLRATGTSRRYLHLQRQEVSNRSEQPVAGCFRAGHEDQDGPANSLSQAGPRADGLSPDGGQIEWLYTGYSRWRWCSVSRPYQLTARKQRPNPIPSSGRSRLMFQNRLKPEIGLS